MFSFDGDFRRKPQQDLSGSTRKEKREALLQRAQSERLKREESRRQHNSAILIQAFYRGHRTRCILRSKLREDFDRMIRESNISQWTVEDLVQPLSYLLAFYSEMACMSQILVRLSSPVINICISGNHSNGASNPSAGAHQNSFSESTMWAWKLRKLLHICLCHAVSIAAASSTHVDEESSASGAAAGMALPLRMLEIFTFQEGLEKIVGQGNSLLVVRHLFVTYQYLIRKGVTPRPPTPLAACLVDLVARPLLLLSASKEPSHVSPHPSEAIRLFTVPYLASLPVFPYIELLEALQPSAWPDEDEFMDVDEEDSEEDSCHCDGKSGAVPKMSKHYLCLRVKGGLNRVSVPQTTWLLYSLLTLEGRQYGLNRDASGVATLNYLRILACLTTWISKWCRGKGRIRDGGSNCGQSSLCSGSNSELEEDEEEDIEEEERSPRGRREERQVIDECVMMLNDPGRVNSLLAAVDQSKDPSVMNALCRLCHNLLLSRHLAVHQFRLLYMLAFKPSFLRRLWSAILTASQISPLFGPSPESATSKGTSSNLAPFSPSNSRLNLLRLISGGVETSPEEAGRIVPLLAVFCALFTLLIVTLHDGEFYADGSLPGGESNSISHTQCQENDAEMSKAGQHPQQKVHQSTNFPVSNSPPVMPFTLPELASLSLSLKDACLGLVELAFPESRPGVRDDYRTALRGQPQSVWTYGPEGVSQQGGQSQRRRIDRQRNKWRKKRSRHVWSHLFKACVSLLRQLHTRDARRPFCPEGHWISRQVAILQTDSGVSKGSSTSAMTMVAYDLAFRRRGRPYRPFQGLRALTQEEMEDGPPLSTREVRTATILREVPFVVAFQERVLAFQGLVLRDKMERQGEAAYFLQGPSIHISVRRTHLYEDAYEKLSPDNEPDLRLKMRVQMVNAVGMGEAGVDGGGVFREFLSELIKTTFDPNRGFFRLTRDNTLYPSPGAPLILGQDFPRHYYFAGRILGKALYENLLVELPLADFFLSKLVGRHSDVDVHHLASLDPQLHRNLIYLKSYDGDIADLNLDFTVINEELGETRVDELKPGGANIPVTATNRIEYIHLMADYKLNRQIRAQCNAFKQVSSSCI
ncbi:hypothetical protein J437_LFUL004210 [Ladona fulva]|uniref:HECT-type E3 ubiquitin transferase n=1 Tax=Ladona fulva TaxID=123851 RepID=A0A8K0JYP2_LADFU|nr:hypothetical protein J437_LFUL004210 [Ladona fulva]